MAGIYVYLLTTGDGSDGNEWDVHSVHASLKSARAAKEDYEKPRTRPNGSTYSWESQIEKWELGNTAPGDHPEVVKDDS